MIANAIVAVWFLATLAGLVYVWINVGPMLLALVRP